jgi:hypothetical protein
MAQKSINIKHSLLLTGMFRFKPAIQFGEPYHSVLICLYNMEDIICNKFCKFNKS